jgi:thioredoxin-dependent peroxiredoxin
MPSPANGSIAPDFELPTANGTPFRLSAQRGHPVVLYFYPQDDTEGCTVENIRFSELKPEFDRLGVVVVGISPDSVADHCAFRDKYRLGINLAADPERQAVDAYGLWQPKRTFGRDYVGLVRTSFLIDAEGRIVEQWVVRRIKGHAEEVLAAARRHVER